jgi:hypothetical protein
MRRYVRSVFALPLFAILIAPLAAKGETIIPMFFDGFQADTADILDSALVNWNVISGSVDVLSAGNLCGPSGDYSNCVDLDGTGALAGTIQTKQAFALDPGQYRLTFDLAGANRRWPGSDSNTVTVSLGSFFAEDFTMLQYDPFETYTRDIDVVTPGVANIIFAHQGADWIGLLLDNVSLTHVIPDEPDVIPTPEPGSWELIGSALLLLGWQFRKRLANLA